jgi:hypothetical protein
MDTRVSNLTRIYKQQLHRGGFRWIHHFLDLLGRMLPRRDLCFLVPDLCFLVPDLCFADS